MTIKNIENILSKGDSGEKYIACFLQNDAKKVYLNIHLPPAYRGSGSWAAEVGFPLNGKKQMNDVRDLLGGIKLNIFDPDSKSIEEKTEFYLSDACPEFGMNVEFFDGSFMLLYIQERLRDIIGANLSVRYDNFAERKNRTRKYFTALICDKEKKLIIDLANNMFDEFVKKRL